MEKQTSRSECAICHAKLKDEVYDIRGGRGNEYIASICPECYKKVSFNLLNKYNHKRKNNVQGKR